MNRRWSRLREVVEHALDLEADARAGWLAEQCADDAELRAEAEALLGSALEDERFLEPVVRRAPALAAGDRVGPYRLVRLLASGGMGTVYEAERDEPRRRVALKLMRTGLHGPGAAARFRYEVEVLAKLQHPHVAAMYETGVHVEEGRELPWFAMEYVTGARPLVAYAREEGLDVRARVALFADACDGVQHGHAHGVLHRDLKPDNVLVDRAGHCKVIDFGVARATDADLGLTTLRTSTGEIVGTLAYMSPEQVAGERDALDTRSDVYALGVVLYELLTGELPYDVRGTGTFAAMRTIRDTAPRRPGAVAPALRGDLETILLKCLSKEPERRYATAAGLAQDLRRFLRHEPIAAHPPSVTYQLRVFARRHRGLVAAALIVVAVSVAAAIVSATYAVHAGRAERAAIAEKERSTEMFETLLKRSMEANTRFVPRLIRLSGASPIVLEMTEANLADLEALEGLAAEDPRARREIARAYLSLGTIQGDPDSAANLGDRAATLRAYRRCLEIARDLHDAQPGDDDALHLHALALASLGYVEAHEKAHAAARQKLERAEDLLEEYVGRHPDEFRGTRSLAVVVRRLAVAANLRGDRESARRYTLRSRDGRLAMAERWPDRPAVRYDLATAHVQVGTLQQNDGEFEDALRSFEASISLLEPLVASARDNTLYRQSLAGSLRAAGALESNTGRLDAGTRKLQRSLDILLELREKDPSNKQLPMSIILTRYCLGQACERQAAAEEEETARRGLLIRARDAYDAIVRHYEEQGKGEHGLAAQVRGHYERLVAELGEG